MSQRFDRVIIHAGVHKTGSTAIQNALNSNQRRLLDQRALAVIVNKREINDALQAAAQANPEERKSAFAERILQPFPQGTAVRTLLLSWEGLPGPISGGYPEAAARAGFLAECLQGERVQVYFFVRRQDDFIESGYLQKVKEGYAKSFDEHFREEVEPADLNWSRLCAAWENAFGRDSVHLRAYERDFEPVGFLKSFFDWISVEIELDPAQNQKRANQSLGPQGLRLMLELNRAGLPRDIRRECRFLLQEHLSRGQGSQARLLGNDQRRFLRDRYNDENRQLAERFGFSPKALEISEAVGEDEDQSAEAAKPISDETLLKMIAEQQVKRQRLEMVCDDLNRRLQAMESAARKGGGFLGASVFWKKYKSLAAKVDKLHQSMKAITKR